MKKIIVLFLTAALTLSTFVGCKNDATPQGQSDQLVIESSKEVSKSAPQKKEPNQITLISEEYLTEVERYFTGEFHGSNDEELHFYVNDASWKNNQEGRSQMELAGMLSDRLAIEFNISHEQEGENLGGTDEMFSPDLEGGHKFKLYVYDEEGVLFASNENAPEEMWWTMNPVNAE